ncbi:MAG TPA: lysine--tRNA ligase [Nitrospirae bacterium]|nr:lysine--tRNA ligase [Nitrospirota bacterium]
MEELGEQTKQRINKLRELKELGIDPYKQSFNPKDTASNLITTYKDYAKESFEQEQINVSISGRIVALRDFGKASFAHIQDSTDRIQIYLKKDALGDKFIILKKLDIGDIIGIKGRLFRTKTNELTVEVHDLTILCKSLHPLPEKWHGLKDVEIRYRQRYLDLIVNPEVKEIFAQRSAIIKAIRDFFESKGFIEVETPMMHLIPGGATARPFKTHHNALDLDLFLRIAPELYLKRLLVGGYDKIFEINKNFRNEGISTKHNPEFTMMEFYIAYKDYKYLMELTEELITSVTMKVKNSLEIPYENTVINLTPPWKRFPLLDALKEKGVPEEIFNDATKAMTWARGKGIDIDSSMQLGKILDEIFKELVEPELIQPTFIIDHPVELSPLAKRKPENPNLVERFELFIAGREIANAFSELNDPLDQRERFINQVEAKNKGDDEAHEMDEDFVTALEYGMPPAAGEGIGIDRLVMLLTNSKSIRDVILFPLLKPER